MYNIELTKQQMAGMFATYYNCEIQVSNLTWVIDPAIKSTCRLLTMPSVVYDANISKMGYVMGCDIKGVWQHEPYSVFINDIHSPKLILTPLSEITEEDAIELGKMCNYVIFDKFENYSYKSRFTDYLRSRHYDCGYLHIPSLIEAGYAVSKIDKTSKI